MFTQFISPTPTDRSCSRSSISTRLIVVQGEYRKGPTFFSLDTGERFVDWYIGLLAVVNDP